MGLGPSFAAKKYPAIFLNANVSPDDFALPERYIWSGDIFQTSDVGGGRPVSVGNRSRSYSESCLFLVKARIFPPFFFLFQRNFIPKPPRLHKAHMSGEIKKDFPMTVMQCVHSYFQCATKKSSWIHMADKNKRISMGFQKMPQTTR